MVDCRTKAGKIQEPREFCIVKKIMLKKGWGQRKKKVYILGDSISKKVKINC